MAGNGRRVISRKIAHQGRGEDTEAGGRAGVRHGARRRPRASREARCGQEAARPPEAVAAWSCSARCRGHGGSCS